MGPGVQDELFDQAFDKRGQDQNGDDGVSEVQKLKLQAVRRTCGKDADQCRWWGLYAGLPHRIGSCPHQRANAGCNERHHVRVGEDVQSSSRIASKTQFATTQEHSRLAGLPVLATRPPSLGHTTLAGSFISSAAGCARNP